jgi:hypothetical protein
MLAEIQSAATAFSLGCTYMDRLVGDFSPADWAVRDAAGHDPRWIAGHVTVYRNRVITLMGLEAPVLPWENTFTRGATAADVPADLDMAEVVKAFHAAGAILAGGWEGLGKELLDQPLGRTLPDGSDTKGGCIRFLAWHEAYHLGQLGMFRRLAGKAGVA